MSSELSNSLKQDLHLKVALGRVGSSSFVKSISSLGTTVLPSWTIVISPFSSWVSGSFSCKNMNLCIEIFSKFKWRIDYPNPEFRFIDEDIRVQGSKLRGGWIFKIAGGPPKFWVLLHFYVTISKNFPICMCMGGKRGVKFPPLSPCSLHPLPPLREVKIGKIFEIVT